MTIKPSLNPLLKDFWKTKARYHVLYGGRASGKCLAIGTKVTMSDYTLRNVEHICVGDCVMGADGKPRKVLNTTRGIAELFKIKQHFGKDYIVNSDHVLSLKKRDGVKNDKGELFPSGNYRRPNGRYPNESDIVNISVNEYLKKSKKWRDNFRGYKSGLINFPVSNPLPVEAYFIGLWLGDGCYREPQITSMDNEVIEYCKGFSERNNVTIKLYQKKNQQAQSISFCKKNGNINPLWAEMVRLGICQHRDRKVKSESKKRIPLSYLTASESDRLNLLAGLIDSDGTYSKDKNCFVFSQVNADLFDDVVRLINGLGFRATTSIKKTKCNEKISVTNSVTITGELSRIPTKIERKKANDCINKSDLLTNTLIVEPIGLGEYAGFEIDGDHLFLLEDHTVTHNSWDAAGFITYLASTYCVRVVCCRQFLNRSGDSIYALLKNQIARFGLSKEFDIQSTKITHKITGSHISFYGLFRNIEEVKSLEGVDICLLEEAANLTEEQFEILNPTFRKKGFMFIIVFNPVLATDFVYKRFVVNPIHDSVVKKFNYLDNPYLDSEYIENVINPLMKEDIDDYNHVYLGNPRDNDDDSIIKRSWIMAAIDAHKKLNLEPTGTKRLGFDVADSGADKCATVLAHGWVITGADMWKGKEDELLKSCTRAYNNALKYDAQITYDSIGVGAGSGAKFKELNGESDNRLQYAGFNAGGAVFNPDGYYEIKKKNRDMFSNIKAQAWWLLGDRFRNTYNAVNHGQEFKPDELISIDSNTPFLELLIDELSTPKRDYDQAGRVKVESKKDLAKRDIPSPNLADAAVMAFAPGYSKIKINNSVFGII